MTVWSRASSSSRGMKIPGWAKQLQATRTGGPSPRASQWISTPSGRFSRGTVRDLADRVSRADRPAADDVGANPAAAGEAAQHTRLRELLQVVAGRVVLDPEALDVAHVEALAHELEQAHAARGDLASALARPEHDAGLVGEPLERLRLDQRDVAPGLLPGVVGEVAVAGEPLAGSRLDLGHLVKRPGVRRSDEDAVYRSFAHAMKRATLSATQTGFSPPSISTVNLVTACHQPLPTSSTDMTSEYARRREPAGTGAGK